MSSALPTPTTFMISWTEHSSSSQPAARSDDGGGYLLHFSAQIDTIGMLLQDLEKYQEHPFTIFLEDQLLVGNLLLPNQNKQTSLSN